MLTTHNEQEEGASEKEALATKSSARRKKLEAKQDRVLDCVASVLGVSRAAAKPCQFCSHKDKKSCPLQNRHAGGRCLYWAPNEDCDFYKSSPVRFPMRLMELQKQHHHPDAAAA